jgi:DNA-binding IclR family transcriptional regulator
MTSSDSAGAQTVDRAVAILRHLASAGEAGLRLVDLQKITALSKPTVHRILASLSHHGLVEQSAGSRRYRLGMEMAVLGWSVSSHRYDLRELSSPEMQALAEETGDTAFLAVRSGYDLVCIERKMGPYPIKAFTVDVGTRRPLGVGAGGIAMIASLSEQEAEIVYESIRGRLGDYPHVSEPALREAVAAAHKTGYALSNGFVLEGVRGLAVTINDARGRAVAALSISAIQDRIQADRIPKLLAALDDRRRRIERKLAEFR